MIKIRLFGFFQKTLWEINELTQKLTAMFRTVRSQAVKMNEQCYCHSWIPAMGFSCSGVDTSFFIA